MIDLDPLLFFFLFFIAIILFGLFWSIASHATDLASRRPKQRHAWGSFYVGRGEFVRYSETDLRLTYKRFKELYPYSKMTYQEYKKLQSEKAFKRAVSSQKIKRMVR